MADQTYKSGCACGGVQLEITGEPAVQAYCHRVSCRSWLSAPIHAAALWPAQNVKVVKGADNLGLYKKTEASHRQFCKTCGAGVLVGHPAPTRKPSIAICIAYSDPLKGCGGWGSEAPRSDPV